MRHPTANERVGLETGVRSSDAYVMRRCQLLLANWRGETAVQIGQHFGLSDQTVRAFDGERTECLRALLHESPFNFGQPTNVWTLALVAEVSYAQGLTSELVSAETVRATAERLGIGWRRAK